METRAATTKMTRMVLGWERVRVRVCMSDCMRVDDGGEGWSRSSKPSRTVREIGGRRVRNLGGIEVEGERGEEKGGGSTGERKGQVSCLI